MTGDVLVINTGSSGLKYAVFQPTAKGPIRCESGQIDGIGVHGATDYGAAPTQSVERLRKETPDWKPSAIGHRIVHGGARFVGPAIIDATTRVRILRGLE
jgi:acetate kinase